MEPHPHPPGLGPALRRAWVGYRLRVDAELAAAGFADRRFPDGRVLRICSGTDEVTISRLGRELGITRQGAGKIVAGLRERGYVTVRPSPADGREKIVELAPRAVEYLAAQREAARTVERRLRADVGDEAFDGLHRLLTALDDGRQQPRLADYLRAGRDPDAPDIPAAPDALDDLRG